MKKKVGIRCNVPGGHHLSWFHSVYLLHRVKCLRPLWWPSGNLAIPKKVQNHHCSLFMSSCSLVVLLVVNVSCDHRAKCMSMSSVSKHMERSVGGQHTVHITMCHRLKMSNISNLFWQEWIFACRVWWDGKGASEHEKNSSLVLCLSSLILQTQTSMVGVRQWFGIMNLWTEKILLSTMVLTIPTCNTR